jgi:hypothetical protein
MMTDKKGHMMRRKSMLVIGLLAVFALPASAVAGPPSKADKRSAVKECKAERGTDEASREAFKAKYGSFGKCVSAGARENKAERKEQRSNAARECRAEREAQGVEAFREQYGTNANKRNAFGKCVSSKVKQQRAEEEQEEEQETAETHNAAQACSAEREATGEDAFAEKYGTNGNKRNAFGKCVSAAAGEQETAPAA